MGEKNVKKNLLASEVKPKTTKYYTYLFCTIFPYFCPLMLGHHTRRFGNRKRKQKISVVSVVLDLEMLKFS